MLSAWAVRNLRFDEALAGRHGYDVDICMQAAAAGRRVVTADLRVVHHHSLELLGDPESGSRPTSVAEKWDGRLPDADARPDWRRRARRAEAEAAAARLRMGAAELQRNDARGKLMDTWRSSSWTWTEPLRRLGARIRKPR